MFGSNRYSFSPHFRQGFASPVSSGARSRFSSLSSLSFIACSLARARVLNLVPSTISLRSLICFVRSGGEHGDSNLSGSPFARQNRHSGHKLLAVFLCSIIFLYNALQKRSVCGHRKALITAARGECPFRIGMSDELHENRPLDLASVHLARPRCFGTLRRHIIVCNECSKQYECMKEYNSHELLLSRA